MTIREFEYGKTQIMAEAREALRDIGVESHCVMFDVHGSQPLPDGAALTLTIDGNSISSWFTAAEISGSCDGVSRPDVRQKVTSLVAGVKEPVTG